MPSASTALLLAVGLVPVLFTLRWLAACLLDMAGLRAYPRQIIRILPAKPAILKLRDGNAADGNTTFSAGGREKSLSEWISDNVPSLKGTFTPSWWLPK